MSVTEAIDALLEFVPDGLSIPRAGELRDRFDTLDRAVYVEACRSGLDGKLPPPAEGGFESLGLTNLPGLWTIGSKAAFHSGGLRAWRNRLLALRDIAGTAEPKIGEQSADGTINETSLPFSLTENDVRVLLYLLQKHPRLCKQADIVTGARIARNTVSNSLARLCTAGFVHRPAGERQGNCLTDEGKKCAEILAKQSSR